MRREAGTLRHSRGVQLSHILIHAAVRAPSTTATGTNARYIVKRFKVRLSLRSLPRYPQLPELASLHSQLFGKLRVALSPMIGPAAMPTSRVASRTLGLGSPLLILLYGFYTPGFAERESSGIRQIPWRAIYRAVQ